MKINTIIAALMFAAGPHLLAADAPSLPLNAKPVYDNYMKIQSALAADSMKGVVERAGLIAKAAEADESKTLPPALVRQAENLAQAKDLAGARDAFKPLSTLLIQYLADQKVPTGSYYEVYCPMAKASWLQTNKVISNPYMGKAMSTCGEIKD